MARTTQQTTPVKAAEKVVPAFTWDDLPESEVAEYSRTPIRVDLEEVTPAVIKKRVQEAFDLWNGSEESQRKFAWKIQACGSSDRAEEFVKLARRYATFREMTFRGTQVPTDSTKVRFMCKTRETRAPRQATVTVVKGKRTK